MIFIFIVLCEFYVISNPFPDPIFSPRTHLHPSPFFPQGMFSPQASIFPQAHIFFSHILSPTPFPPQEIVLTPIFTLEPNLILDLVFSLRTHLFLSPSFPQRMFCPWVSLFPQAHILFSHYLSMKTHPLPEPFSS
jgi:hypothetical protein